ncbi:unnamed protein product [Effrenium voratum]|nr:unnamed protein product [Effrenium voratum]
MGSQCCSGTSPDVRFSIGAGHDDIVKALGKVGEDAEMAAVVAGLAKIVHEHPYLKPMGTERAPHHLLFWVRSCREAVIANHIEDAKGYLERVQTSLNYEMAQVDDSFRRFDVDKSGKLDSKEFVYMCAYIGWGEEEASMMDVDNDCFVTLEEFRHFVGDSGGLQALFEHRRQRVARKQWGVEAPSVLEIGARVRSYYTMPDGKKSAQVKEGQVLELRVMPNNGVLIDFVDPEKQAGSSRQVVPQSWIFSDTRDSDVVSALREVGILEDQQAFWAAIFPESEMRAVEKLAPCQRAALQHVRANASASHEAALPAVRERFGKLGYSEAELQACLGWIQDLAPTVVHIHIDRVGRFMETDEYYRSQFETGTSSGALDSKNAIRQRWEMDLFGGSYENCKPFERCKYGALGVMNDFRGVTSAYGYGDSYLVLKDVRLRCTFASTDSGGISGQRLAVLDKYAHVLKEYSDEELRHLIDVAMSNTSLHDMPQIHPTLLRGMSEDPMENWITVGFPNLAQRKGRYFFEVVLYTTCSSPQVGLLCSDFVSAPRSASFLGGVGDDEHGWAADGQHAILWHNGERLPFSDLWPSSGGNLTADVVVGVAVDLDKRQIWFSTNGEWHDQPDFSEKQLRKGLTMYPALSVKGRAGFNFGPEFKHEAPKNYGRWPGGDGLIRVDCPILGNSNRLRVYKEIQIHGEVSFKRNVQRLVANKKFLEIQKSQRSWAITVDGLDAMNGTYSRAGARNDMPLYLRQECSGAIYFSKKSGSWHVVKLASLENLQDMDLDSQSVLALAPVQKDELTPPREGWERPPELLGYLPVADFQKALDSLGLKDHISKLVAQLKGKTPEGEEVIFRSNGKKTLEVAWEALAEPPVSAEGAWTAAVEVAQEKLFASLGLQKCKVLETAHPYETADHSFTKTVAIATDGPIDVHFGPECRTYDSRTSLCVYGGGLSKALVGVGARVHLKVPTGHEEAHGTIIGRAEGGKWRVRVDKDEAEICGVFKEWIESSDNGKERYCTSCVAETQKVCTVRYEGRTVGSEIAGFRFDTSDPLAPFAITGFNAKGPAQSDGVMVGWFLDVGALLKEESFIELEGEELGVVPRNLSEVASNIEQFQKRLTALLQLQDVSLRFVNGLDFQLLPQCNVKFDQDVGSEISGFEENGGVITISGFHSTEGPAQQAGTRKGWQLNLPETFQLPINKAKLQELSQEAIIKDPSQLLSLSEVMLIFEPAAFEPEQYFKGSGQGPWTKFTVPINTAQFVFTTDGDRGAWSRNNDPKLRYGFLAVVTPGGAKAPPEEKVQELMEKWGDKATKASGMRSKITLEPEDWDEARLRALCARHGWEFEWMTEDGERRRRIEGAQRARKVAQKCTKKEGDSGAWWRLGSVSAAFGAAAPKKQAKRITQAQADAEPDKK